MSDYTDLQNLLDHSAGASGYYEDLPAPLRAALRRQERITSFAELQSFVAYERETV